MRTVKSMTQMLLLVVAPVSVSCGQVWNNDSSQCGNTVVDSSEECDGSDLGGETCSDLGFRSGALACTAFCTFDSSGCFDGCGNGMLESQEQCDGSNLGGATCLGEGYDGGILGCTEVCTFDYTECLGEDPDAPQGCGNGIVESPEECDGSDLGGASCVDHGFAWGYLVCRPNCTHDTSGCCANDCPFVGAQRCATDTLLDICELAEDGCLHWEFLADCDTGVHGPDGGGICVGAMPNTGCISACVDKCEVGQSLCMDGALWSCMPYAAGCLDYFWVAECGEDAETCSYWEESLHVYDNGWAYYSEQSGSDIGTDFDDNHNFTGEGCGAASGPEAFFSFRLGLGEALQFRETGGVDVRIRIVDACDPFGGCLAETEDEEEGLIFTTTEFEHTYFVIFEAIGDAPTPADYSFHFEQMM